MRLVHRSVFGSVVSVFAGVIATAGVLATSVTVFYATSRPGGSGTLDSVALWAAPDPAQSVLFVTDKTRNVVEMHNPVTNTFLGDLGTSGAGNGQFSRPNGIAVAGDLALANGIDAILFVVERDNRRVSMFSLPDRTYRGQFGASQLGLPYGIAIYQGGGQLQAWITDDGLNRVFIYDIAAIGQGLAGNLNRSFAAGGTLESIAIDTVSRRALVADEGAGDVMVYDFAGSRLQRFGSGRFVSHTEGVAIYDLGNGAGYILVADQYASPTEFEVFDRATYQWLGNFSGTTTGTDGTTLTQCSLPNLPGGAFFAVHADSRVHCYQWRDIAAALGLQARSQECATNPATLVVAAPNGGETWALGSIENITWASSGVAGPVRLELSIDAGATWAALAGDVANTGSYSWTIAAGPTRRARVRILDADGSPSDASDADFVIAGPPADLAATSGDGQSAPPGTTLPQPFVVRVTDAAGTPLASVSVLFDMVSGDGTLGADPLQTTEAQGRASIVLTLGPVAGTNSVRATCAGLAPAVFTATAIPSAASSLIRGPYLQRVTEESALVVWRTSTALACTLAYGPQGSFVSSVVTPSGTQHVASLAGLQAGTRYDYRLRGGGSLLAGGSDCYLRTAAAAGSNSTVRLLVWGDSGTGSQDQMDVAAVLDAESADVGLHVGDVIYPGGEAQYYDPRYFQPYAPLLRHTPVWAAIGNHDNVTPQAFLDAWYLPTNSLDGSERFYSFDFGAVHCVALDTNVSLGSGVLAWLDADLQATSRRWKVVFFHHTMYSCGSYHGSSPSLIATLAPIFEARGVDLVFYGHDHHYERSFPMRAGQVVDAAMEPDYVNPGGPIYVVSGGGGGTRPVETTCVHTARALAVLHFLRIEVAGDRIVIEPIGTSGAALDRMTLTKGSLPPPPQTLDLLAPDGGEVAEVGSSLQFRWSASADVGPVRIELSRSGSNGPWETLFASTPDDASESWSVSGAASNDCWARLSEAADGQPFDRSRAAFRITLPPPPPPPPPGAVTRINFQPAAAPVPSGYQVDAGLSYDAGRGYGWTRTMVTKARNILPGDRRDTFVDIVNNEPVGTWEVAVAPGSYRVSLTCGDPSASATHRVTLEGQVVVANVYTGGGQWLQRTDLPVTVNDGRLSVVIGGIGNLTHTKLNCIEIAATTSNAPPSVVIAVPAADVAVPNEQTAFDFQGTAADGDGSVARVEYRVRGGTWNRAAGTVSWSFTATGLAVGVNLVEVRSVDDLGAASAIAARTVTRSAPAQYTLTVATSGSGTVGLDPPGGVYAPGTVVTLTATPSAGWLWSGWSGDLAGSANPAPLAMTANKSVAATFTPQVTSGPITLEEIRTGVASATSSVTSAALVGGNQHLYLAAVTSRPNLAVISVTGLGLTWTFVRAQCSGRNQTGISVWKAQGTPSGAGAVTAQLSGNCTNAVIAVSRYSGAATSNAVGNVVAGNSRGTSGSCSGGSDSNAYSFELTTTSAGAVVYGVVALRDKRHTPGSGYTERVELQQGSSGEVAGVAIEDRTSTPPGLAAVNGTFSAATDWAFAGLEIRPAPVAKPLATTSARPASPLLIGQPNPFNASTHLRYVLPAPAHVRLTVCDVSGRIVARLVDGPRAAGTHEVAWDARTPAGRSLAGGIYLCRLQAGTRQATIKPVLLE